MMLTRPAWVVLAIALGAQLLACSDDARDCAEGAQLHAGSIEITGAEGSARLEELECVQVVTGSLTISDRGVRSLESLRSLVHVLGDVSITRASLESLHGLEQLAAIGGGLTLTELENLESLDGLEGLRNLDGDLKLVRLPKLASLEALGDLEAIGGSLTLDSLASLVTFEGLGRLGNIGGDLTISDNSALTDLDALQSLTSIEGAYRLMHNSALISASFPSHSDRSPSIGRDIVVSRNSSLRTLTRFGVPLERDTPCDILRGVLSGISVSDNGSLEQLELPDGRVANITVSGNDRLASLSGLERYGSACILSLRSLPNLTSVNLTGWAIDALEISNTGIANLDGLGNTEVICSLRISGNAELVDLRALSREAGSAYDHEFDISDNQSLATCQVQAVVDALPLPTRQCLVAGRVTGGARRVSIEGNDDSASCE